MLRLITGNHHTKLSASRREFLRICGLGGLIMPLAGPKVAASPAEGRAPGFGRAKSVILVYTNGGQSQHETWDPKPKAPQGIRGEFAAIPTVVPGTFISEHLPRLAAMADQFTIIRSMSHDDLDHGSATYLALTGHYHTVKSSNPQPAPSDSPTYGAVLKRVRPSSLFPYTAVHVNGPAFVPLFAGPGQSGGFLGHDCDPMLLGDVHQQVLGSTGLRGRPELPTVRIESRRSLLESIDGFRRQLDRGRRVGDLDGLYAQAYRLIASPLCRNAFDLSREKDGLRDRYGRNRAGQACLLARRLVEANVPWITVFFNHNARGQDDKPNETDSYGWDTHNDIFVSMKKHLMPRFDQGFSALLQDLQQRGLLETTLVVCMGEFGRAPRIALERGFAGTTPGRKHWASVYSIVMAGAGVGRGKVYGASDRIAAFPQAGKAGPWDVAATMFSALGINPTSQYRDVLGRPFEVSTGQPMVGLYS